MSKQQPIHAYFSAQSLEHQIGRLKSPLGDRDKKQSVIALKFYQSALNPEAYTFGNLTTNTLVPSPQKPTDMGAIVEPPLAVLTLSQVLDFFTDNTDAYLGGTTNQKIVDDIKNNISVMCSSIKDVISIADQLRPKK